MTSDLRKVKVALHIFFLSILDTTLYSTYVTLYRVSTGKFVLQFGDQFSKSRGPTPNSFATAPLNENLRKNGPDGAWFGSNCCFFYSVCNKIV